MIGKDAYTTRRAKQLLWIAEGAKCHVQCANQRRTDQSNQSGKTLWKESSSDLQIKPGKWCNSFGASQGSVFWLLQFVQQLNSVSRAWRNLWRGVNKCWWFLRSALKYTEMSTTLSNKASRLQLCIWASSSIQHRIISLSYKLDFSGLFPFKL